MTYFLRDRNGNIHVSGNNEIGQTGLSRELYPDVVEEFVRLDKYSPCRKIISYKTNNETRAIIITNDGTIVPLGKKEIIVTDENGNKVEVVDITFLPYQHHDEDFISLEWSILDNQGILRIPWIDDEDVLYNEVRNLPRLKKIQNIKMHSNSPTIYAIDQQDSLLRFTIVYDGERFRAEVEKKQIAILVSQVYETEDYDMVITIDGKLVILDDDPRIIFPSYGLSKIKKISYFQCDGAIFLHDENDDLFEINQKGEDLYCASFLASEVIGMITIGDILLVKRKNGEYLSRWLSSPLSSIADDEFLKKIDIDFDMKD